MLTFGAFAFTLGNRKLRDFNVQAPCWLALVVDVWLDKVKDEEGEEVQDGGHHGQKHADLIKTRSINEPLEVKVTALVPSTLSYPCEPTCMRLLPCNDAYLDEENPEAHRSPKLLGKAIHYFEVHQGMSAALPVGWLVRTERGWYTAEQSSDICKIIAARTLDYTARVASPSTSAPVVIRLAHHPGRRSDQSRTQWISNC